ncbi:MAG: hypothetical protein KJ955_07895 [Nanoarchaeota archaeon]|nr:hypothetical protein [Nanoarchaeota archaeon]
MLDKAIEMEEDFEGFFKEIKPRKKPWFGKGLAALAAAASLTMAVPEEARAYHDDRIGTLVEVEEGEYTQIRDPNPNIFPDEYMFITLAGTLILDGPVKCGLGALILDTDFEECIGPALLGGLLDFTGMAIARYDYPFMGGLGKLTHDWGVSISNNVMIGIPMFDRFQTDFGPVLFSIEHMTTDPELNVYVQPGGIAGILANFALGNRFEVLETLYNLTPTFTFPNQNAFLFGSRVRGFTLGSVIAYGRGEDTDGLYYVPQTRAHELNHALMYQSIGRMVDDLLYPEVLMEAGFSLGPDLAMILLQAAPTLMYAIDSSTTDIHRYFPLEFAAYSMEQDP